ncbi:ABC transporter ATP-binding protein [Arthrobacter sp. SD76]|uniref:ABC transporter ATP-binding protein n=1 Tax=Arthrobacter sp. SD76 TaxID=3415007 RepID=UPI003C70FB56
MPETTHDQDEPVLQLRGIVKRFGTVIANAGIDFDLRGGEIHAIVGENGAGKSTLMKILYGMIRPDEGEVLIQGETVRFRSASDALARGIGMVHQHFMLVPEFTVLQNLVLGAEPTKLGMVNEHESREMVQQTHSGLLADTSLDSITGTLSIAKQQRVEILKVLIRGARVVILDEPTAVLTPQECDELFTTLRALADDGYSVIFISHKLREVTSVADRVTVIRSGRTIGTWNIDEVDIDSLVVAMTGRTDVNLGRVIRGAPRAEFVLEMKNVSGTMPGDSTVNGINLSVRAGEIVGVAGVDGNGQDTLVGVLTGRAAEVRGEVILDGVSLGSQTMLERRNLGLSYVPGDRHTEGIPLNGSVLEGLSGVQLAASKGPGLELAFPAARKAWAKRQIGEFSIKAKGIGALCASLSGGNQQKVVIARELDRTPRCLLLVQPTRGVDIGSADLVYNAIANATEAGLGVLLISADLDELLRLSDRIAVLYRGEIVAEHAGTAADREALGADMTGASIGAMT